MIADQKRAASGWKILRVEDRHAITDAGEEPEKEPYRCRLHAGASGWATRASAGTRHLAASISDIRSSRKRNACRAAGRARSNTMIARRLTANRRRPRK